MESRGRTDPRGHGEQLTGHGSYVVCRYSQCSPGWLPQYSLAPISRSTKHLVLVRPRLATSVSIRRAFDDCLIRNTCRRRVGASQTHTRTGVSSLATQSNLIDVNCNHTISRSLSHLSPPPPLLSRLVTPPATWHVPWRIRTRPQNVVNNYIICNFRVWLYEFVSSQMRGRQSLREQVVAAVLKGRCVRDWPWTGNGEKRENARLTWAYELRLCVEAQRDNDKDAVEIV